MSQDDRPFVDREAYIQVFRDNLQNSGTKEYNVLFYYGIAGIGKSKLQKELQSILNREYPEILWVAIDLSTKTYREVGTFLIILRNKIQEKSKAKFYLFNIAHAIYWKKLHPEATLLEMNYPLIKEGKFFSKIIDILNEFGPAKLIWDTFNNAPDNVRRVFKEQAIDISVLTAMEASEIEKLLPKFFAADFMDYLGTDSNAYIFIDTYEALWEGLRNRGSFHEKDEWIRGNLIPKMIGVSWVIFGREKLLWASECDPEWKMYLNQHLVYALPKKDCTRFLVSCGIKSKNIRKVIFEASEGVPYYLNLSVDTFEKINKKRSPVPEDFSKTQPKIFNNFVKYLEGNEIKALEVLSVPNSWDRNLFKTLMSEFDTGYHASKFSEIIKFSFIKTSFEGKYSIHQLMRKSLQEHQDSVDRENVHEFMFKYYSNNMKKIDIKAITKQDEIALTEAFFHAKESLAAEDLFYKFLVFSNPFKKAAFWKLICPLYEELLKLLDEKLGPKHLNVAKTRSKLASLYCYLGAYKKAIDYYKQALTIEREISNRGREIVDLGNLGNVCRDLGNPKRAVKCHEQALNIAREIGDKIRKKSCLGNLGDVYLDLGNPVKASGYYKQALNIAREIEDKRSEEKQIGNLGNVCRDLGNPKRAIKYHEQALNIARGIGDKNGEENHLGNLGNANRDLGEFEKAIDYYEQALKISREMGDRCKEGIWLGNLGSTYRYLGDHQRAIEHHEQAMKKAKEIDDKRYEGIWLGNLGITYGELKKFEKAVEYHNEALKIAENIGDKRYKGIWLGNLGIAYYNLGERKEGIENYKKALKIAEEIGDKRYEGVWQGYKGDACRDKGDPKKAIDYYEKALKIAEDIGDKRRKGKWKGYMGNAYLDLGQPKEAIDCFKQALGIARDIGDRRRVKTWTEQLVNEYLDPRDHKKASDVLNESLAFGKSIEDQGIIDFCENKLKELEEVN